MQRTLNYTNRRRIEKHEVLFSFTEDGGNIPEFEALFEFNSEYPKDASLYVEAYYRETRQRFDFGKVSKITPPKNCKLDELDLSGSIQFDVLIVDKSRKHGLVLARGTRFKADSDDGEENNRSSILPVKKAQLGQLPWKVEIESGELTKLCLNDSIPNAIEKINNDAVFQSLILPAALKEILTFYLWNEDQDSEEAKRWFAFADDFAESRPKSEDPSELLEWVEEVVEEFAKHHNLGDLLVDKIRKKEQ